MAKQVGPLFFTGTIDGIIFYKVGDKYYTRSKGSYKSPKYMRRNPKYKRTMEKADQFGTASKLVQETYYRHVPKEVRKQGLYGQLTGKVMNWLQEGKSGKEAQELLTAHCQSLSIPTEQRSTLNDQQKTAPPKVEQRPTINEQRSTVNGQPKRARYLSRWKVKRNGHLQILNKEANNKAFQSMENNKPTTYTQANNGIWVISNQVVGIKAQISHCLCATR
jgi:hypothetical protein